MSASARSTDRTQSRLSTDARITSIAELDAEVRMAAHVIGSNGEGPNRALLDEKRRVLLSRKASEESRTAAVIACATAARDGRVVGRAERNADQIQAKREYQQEPKQATKRSSLTGPPKGGVPSKAPATPKKTAPAAPAKGKKK